MDAIPTREEVSADLAMLDTAYKKARADYKEADEAYTTRGNNLARLLRLRTEPYLDPENDRAPNIQHRAHNIVDSTNTFSRLHDQLRFSMALLFLQLDQTLMSLIVELLRWPTNSNIPGTPGDPLEAARSFLAQLNKQEQRAILLTSKALLLGGKTVGAVQLAAKVLNIRLGKMEEYLGEELTINLEAALAAADVFGAELRQEAYKIALAAAAEALGIAATAVVLPLKYFTLGREAYKRYQEVKRRYRRHKVDEMMVFSTDMHTDDEGFEEELKSISAVKDELAAVVRLAGGRR